MTIQTHHLVKLSIFVACLAAAVLPTPDRVVWAHGAGGDIALFATAGQADVGFAILDDDDDVQVFFDPDEDVFLSVLLPITPNPLVPWEFGSSEPGFDADEGTLPPEADISYNLHELWYWDGAGSVDFSPAIGTNAGVAPQPEKSFASGGFHSHPFFGVETPTGDAPEGVYLARMTVSVEGLADSDPYYMTSLVTGVVNGLSTIDEQVAAAEAIGEMVRLYADDPGSNPIPTYDNTDFTFYADAVNFARELAAVPEPSSAMLVVGGCLVVAGFANGRCRRPSNGSRRFRNTFHGVK